MEHIHLLICNMVTIEQALKIKIYIVIYQILIYE